MSDLGFTPEEARYNAAILEVIVASRALFGGTAYNWVEEGIPAIHTLQQFLHQHWAHRICPDLWSDWSRDPGPSALNVIE